MNRYILPNHKLIKIGDRVRPRIAVYNDIGGVVTENPDPDIQSLDKVWVRWDNKPELLTLWKVSRLVHE